MAQNDSPLDILAPEVFYSTPKPARPPKTAQAAKKKTPPQQRSLTAETPSTQPRLRKPKRNVWEKADATLEIITKDFDSLGHFLSVIFYNRISGVADPRTTSHVRVVTAFLTIHNHNGLHNQPHSQPSTESGSKILT
ncbi:hypothetical protein B0H10DRAFT_2227618 [Mycena sp. CBHHK59/15]|nr:hypothetical protein B0H10DRAFT_2227618 [Mycena sp. CBHHK59/15]